MCSRFELNTTAREVAAVFGLESAPPLPNTATLRPTDTALVIGSNGPELQTWGLCVDWTKQPMINARSESVAEKSTFRGLLQTRCLVVATAYFEWRKVEAGGKRKNTIRPADLTVFAMAGLTDGQRFAILTCPPSEQIAHIHNRMPVILSRPDMDAWISAQPFQQVATQLMPHPGPFNVEEEVPAPPAQPDLFA